MGLEGEITSQGSKKMALEGEITSRRSKKMTVEGDLPFGGVCA
jgi:hypothetical protein